MFIYLHVVQYYFKTEILIFQRGTDAKKKSIIYSHFRPCTIIFSTFFLSISVIFAPKNVFIPIQGHQHCGSEWGSQQSFLQLLTNDMI